MSISKISSPIDIAVSGLRAQALNMKVVSANIANANTTKGANGQPYRRQELVLSTDPSQLGGVKVDQVAADMSTPFQRLYQPGPNADKDGFVSMPNVNLPQEMMNMVTASRAYQANAAVLKRFQDTNDTTLELLK